MANAAAAPRNYLDFEPAVEQAKSADGATELIKIVLPGFKRENIKVMLDSRGKLQATGECPVGDGDRWNRFRKFFQVPEGCDASGIRAKFEYGVLQISLPIKNAPAPSKTEAQPQPATAAPRIGGAQPKPATTAAKPENISQKPSSAEATAEPRARDEDIPAPHRAVTRRVTIPPEASLPPKGAAPALAVPPSVQARDAEKASPAKPDEAKMDEETAEVAKAAAAEERAKQERVKRETEGKEQEDRAPVAAGNNNGARNEEAAAPAPTMALTSRPKTRVLLINLSVALILLIGLGMYLAWKMRNTGTSGSSTGGLCEASFDEL